MFCCTYLHNFLLHQFQLQCNSKISFAATCWATRFGQSLKFSSRFTFDLVRSSWPRNFSLLNFGSRRLKNFEICNKSWITFTNGRAGGKFSCFWKVMFKGFKLFKCIYRPANPWVVEIVSCYLKSREIQIAWKIVRLGNFQIYSIINIARWADSHVDQHVKRILHWNTSCNIWWSELCLSENSCI